MTTVGSPGMVPNDRIAEDAVEKLVLQWLRDLGYTHLPGASVTPEGSRPERSGWDSIVLGERLRVALACLNPAVPEDALVQAARMVLREEPSLSSCVDHTSVSKP